MKEMILELEYRCYELIIHGKMIAESENKILMIDYEGKFYIVDKLADTYYLFD